MIVTRADHLVAPAYKQGQTIREVYLPAGLEWCNSWIWELLHGGQAIRTDAPIDTLPLLVRAGSIVTVGEPILSGKKPQKIARIQAYPGTDARFDLNDDDGVRYV